MSKIDVSKLDSAVKIHPDVAANLAMLNRKRNLVNEQMEAAISMALKTGTEQAMAVQEEQHKAWTEALANLGLDPSVGWSADVENAENAYFVNHNILQQEIQRVDRENTPPEIPVEKVGPGCPDPLAEKFAGRDSER
jgi:hypothetical protein